MTTDYTVKEFNKKQVTNPELPPGTDYEPTMQTPEEGELVDAPTIDPNAQEVTPEQGQAQQASDPTEFDPAQYNAEEVDPSATEGQAAQGDLSEQAVVDAAQGTESDAFRDEIARLEQFFANAELDPRASVRYQYEQLMDFEAGEIPEWAAGALREANQQMAMRGLGASTMAAEATTAALMQAALPIASQDANIFKDWSIAKLDKQGQAALLRAGHLAQLDITNLNNRQQAAVINAQNFLQMDLANLSNEQQMAVVNTQARLQSLLSNQAAVNAAQQFNAKSENDVKQFFASLAAQIDTFNTEQFNQLEMFNVNEANAVNQFNSTMANQREQFNTQNQVLIDQFNAQYLRAINTANTAAINEANYVNAMNMLNISNTAMANEILLLRDAESYLFTAGENALNRAENRLLMAMQQEFSQEQIDQFYEYESGSAFGSWAASILGAGVGGILDNWDSIFG